MGDIPHGWAAAELMLLFRDILFFEADEDGDRHIYLAPGVMRHWVGHGQSVSVSAAPTIFGGTFGYRLGHDAAGRTVTLDITEPPPADVRFVYPCRFGQVQGVVADGRPLPPSGTGVLLPPGARHAVITYI